MATNETTPAARGVYVAPMALTKTWHALAALLVAGGLGACSPGAVPVSQSPSDPSNPNAAEGVVPTSASAAPPATHSSKPASTAQGEHAGHGNHGAADAGGGK